MKQQKMLQVKVLFYIINSLKVKSGKQTARKHPQNNLNVSPKFKFWLWLISNQVDGVICHCEYIVFMETHTKISFCIAIFFYFYRNELNSIRMGEVLRSGQFYSGSDFIVMKFRKTICAAFELVWKMHRELYLKLILTIKLFFGLHFFLHRQCFGSRRKQTNHVFRIMFGTQELI